jgi:hypothetical protein
VLGGAAPAARGSDGEMKYFDRVPLNAMIYTGYFNCLYGAALLGRALSETDARSRC